MIVNWTVKENAWTSSGGGDLEYTIGSLDVRTQIMMCRFVQRMMKVQACGQILLQE